MATFPNTFCMNCGNDVTPNLWGQNQALVTTPGRCCTWCHVLFQVAPFNANKSAYNPSQWPDPLYTYFRYPSYIPGAPGNAGLPPAEDFLTTGGEENAKATPES